MISIIDIHGVLFLIGTVPKTYYRNIGNYSL